MTNTNKIYWNFDNSYASLPDFYFTVLKPTPVPNPKLVILNNSLAKSMDLGNDILRSQETINVLAGNTIPQGGLPIAQAYAGHQFGYFTMLGDGRAVLIGEHINQKGDRFDIQLKGAGKTPYSRGGDGRASLGSMLREYIISEAMYGLGIPTTRGLAVVETGEQILRERYLPGAILTRVASSHIRVGTFQYAGKWGNYAQLKAIVDYTIKRHYPEAFDMENPYIVFLEKVIKNQAELIAKWQLVGFIHGVMNTDNMTISGETIDYGPCAFMDIYHPDTVFSSIDRHGRYAYGNQPKIALWNLAKLAESLLPLLHENEDQAIKLAQTVIEKFNQFYESSWLTGMKAKIGIFNVETQDKDLVLDLLNIMQKHQADYTNTFLALSCDVIEEEKIFISGEFENWKQRWKARLERQQESIELSRELMQESNPYVVPRNHLVEEVLKEAVDKGNYHLMEEFLAVISNPYARSSKNRKYTKLPKPASIPYQTFCGT